MVECETWVLLQTYILLRKFMKHEGVHYIQRRLTLTCCKICFI